MNTTIKSGDVFQCTKWHGGEMRTFVATVTATFTLPSGAPGVEYILANGAKFVAVARDFAALYARVPA